MFCIPNEMGIDCFFFVVVVPFSAAVVGDPNSCLFERHIAESLSIVARWTTMCSSSVWNFGEQDAMHSNNGSGSIKIINFNVG